MKKILYIGLLGCAWLNGSLSYAEGDKVNCRDCMNDCGLESTDADRADCINQNCIGCSSDSF